MTGLMIIIIVLLIALIVWALGITILYAQLVRALKRITANDTSAMQALFSSHYGLLNLIRETLDGMEALENLTTEYRKKVDAELERNQENSRFALDTIQQARRIYAQVNTMITNPVSATETHEEATTEEEENNG